MQIVKAIIFVLLTCSFSFASDCKSTQWPFAKEVKDLQPVSLQSIPRDNLYAYLYFELSQPASERIKDLAGKIFFYLKNTELNENKYNLIQALEFAADLKTPSPRVIPVTEICTLEDKISRQPSSEKKKYKTNQSKKNLKK